MDEILEQVAYINQLTDAWNIVNATALNVLKSIDNAIEITTSKIKSLNDIISKILILPQSNVSGVSALSTDNIISNNTVSKTETATNTEKVERKTFLESAAPIVKVTKSILDVAGLLSIKGFGVGKMTAGLGGAEKVIGFGENLKNATGEVAGNKAAETIASSYSVAATAAGVVALIAAATPPMWIVDVAALIVGGIAAWRMYADNRQNTSLMNDKGKASFIMAENLRNDYIEHGPPLPPIIPANGKEAITKAFQGYIASPHLRYSPPMSDYLKTFDRLPNLTIIKREPNAVVGQALVSALTQLGLSKKKDRLDNYIYSLSNSTHDPATLRFLNSTFVKARRNVVDAANPKQNEPQQKQSTSSPGTTININTPLIGTFNINAKNMNESYDKVRQEILHVLLEVFNRAAPAN